MNVIQNFVFFDTGIEQDISNVLSNTQGESLIVQSSHIDGTFEFWGRADMESSFVQLPIINLYLYETEDYIVGNGLYLVDIQGISEIYAKYEAFLTPPKYGSRLFGKVVG